MPRSPAHTLDTLVPKIKWRHPGWRTSGEGENHISFIIFLLKDKKMLFEVEKYASKNFCHTTTVGQFLMTRQGESD